MKWKERAVEAERTIDEQGQLLINLHEQVALYERLFEMVKFDVSTIANKANILVANIEAETRKNPDQ